MSLSVFLSSFLSFSRLYIWVRVLSVAGRMCLVAGDGRGLLFSLVDSFLDWFLYQSPPLQKQPVVYDPIQAGVDTCPCSALFPRSSDVFLLLFFESFFLPLPLSLFLCVLLFAV